MTLRKVNLAQQNETCTNKRYDTLTENKKLKLGVVTII